MRCFGKIVALLFSRRITQFGCPKLSEKPRARAYFPYLAFESLLNSLYQNLVLERFCKERKSSRVECGLAHRRIVAPCDENDPRFRRVSPEAGLHFQTIHLGHPYVEDRYTTSGMFESGEKGDRGAKLFCNETGRAHYPAKRFEHGAVIVEEPDTIAGTSTQGRAFRFQIFETTKEICIGHVIIQS